jgi:carboxypeptidase T
MQVRITGQSNLLIETLKKVRGIDFGCRPHTTGLADGNLQIVCFVPSSALPSVEAITGLTVHIIRNASADGRARQAEVAARHATGKISPADLLAPITGYIQTSEVENRLGAIAAQYSTLCERITLPNKTVGGNTVTMVRVGKQGTTKTKGILFTACAHAREWGGAEICINFLLDLLKAYATGGTVTYGLDTSFTAAQVKQVVETVDLFVLPCINPDGRTFSMTLGGNALWRKNRNGPGVDCNRNYDFLWNYKVDFDPTVANGTYPGIFVLPASDDPNNDLYHGTAPNSEAECRNVIWILDNFPSIGWLLDIHSYSGDTLYSWGNAPDQTTDTKMTFLNPAYNGKRGVPDVDVYGEYIPLQAQLTGEAAAAATVSAIKAVRGQPYVSRQDYALQVGQSATAGYYPTSGAVDDYAYSRHFAQPGKPLVYGFTLEFGMANQPTIYGDFQPPFPEMGNIMAEVDAGLMTFCLFKPDPCAALQQQWSNLSQEVESLQQAEADGEVPQPRTPANIAAFAREMRALTTQLATLGRQLQKCKSGQ